MNSYERELAERVKKILGKEVIYMNLNDIIEELVEVIERANQQK